MDDYIELTSFTHHPYYQKFEVEVPDNWEHAQMYNLPLDEMMQVADYALNNGYTVCWDGDVSEKGFFQEWRGDQPGGKEGGRLLDYRPCSL